MGLEESVRGIEITKQPEDSQVSIRHLLVTNNYISETKIQTAFCLCVTHELTSEVQVPIQLINWISVLLQTANMGSGAESLRIKARIKVSFAFLRPVRQKNKKTGCPPVLHHNIKKKLNKLTQVWHVLPTFWEREKRSFFSYVLAHIKLTNIVSQNIEQSASIWVVKVKNLAYANKFLIIWQH